MNVKMSLFDICMKLKKSCKKFLKNRYFKKNVVHNKLSTQFDVKVREVNFVTSLGTIRVKLIIC